MKLHIANLSTSHGTAGHGQETGVQGQEDPDQGQSQGQKRRKGKDPLHHQVLIMFPEGKLIFSNCFCSEAYSIYIHN